MSGYRNDCGYNAVLSQIRPDLFGGDKLSPSKILGNLSEATPHIKNLRDTATNHVSSMAQTPNGDESMNEVLANAIGDQSDPRAHTGRLQIDTVQAFANAFKRLFITFQEENHAVYIHVPGNANSGFINANELNLTIGNFKKMGREFNFKDAAGTLDMGDRIDDNTTVEDAIKLLMASPKTVALRNVDNFHYHAIQHPNAVSVVAQN
jgi:hypothetical protein